MSREVKNIMLTFGLIFSFLFFSPALAYDFTPDYGFHLNSFGYDNGILTANVSMTGTSPWDRVMFAKSLDWAFTSGFFYDINVEGYPAFNIAKWDCDSTTEVTHDYQTDEIISSSSGEVKCIATRIYVYTNSQGQYVGYNWNSASGFSKSQIDSYFYTDFIEDIDMLSDPMAKWRIFFADNNSFQSGHYLWQEMTAGSSMVNGICGADDGSYLSHSPPTIPYVLCQSGTETTVFYNAGLGQWEWSCLGDNGGSDASCVSYLTTSEVDASCGADDGEILSNPPINFCYDGLLIYPTYVENITGWAWTCGGLNGGSDIFCSATKGNITPPEEPGTEDCDGLTIPNIWFCEIKNILTSAFFPSQAKFTELSETINEVQNRVPFNYIRLAGDVLTDIKNNISTEGLSITILGTTGTITGISALADPIREAIGWLLELGFLVWTVSYIKHFFK